jgi:UDP-3-O-[3-hydroxymyristoyl] glucosamine N-acyltransferase
MGASLAEPVPVWPPGAVVGAGAAVAPGAVVASGAVVAPGAVVASGAVVAPGAAVGEVAAPPPHAANVMPAAEAAESRRNPRRLSFFARESIRVLLVEQLMMLLVIEL